MNTIKRYRYDFKSGIVADSEGGFVGYADYAALAEQVRQLTEQRDAVVNDFELKVEKIVSDVRDYLGCPTPHAEAALDIVEQFARQLRESKGEAQS